MQTVIGGDPCQQQGSSGLPGDAQVFPGACVLFLARCWMAQGIPGCPELSKGSWAGAELSCLNLWRS